MARRGTPGPTTGGIENECVLNDGARARCGDGDTQNLVKERLGKKPKEHRNVEHTRVKETTPKKAHTQRAQRTRHKRRGGEVGMETGKNDGREGKTLYGKSDARKDLLER